MIVLENYIGSMRTKRMVPNSGCQSLKFNFSELGSYFKRLDYPQYWRVRLFQSTIRQQDV